MEDIDSDPDDRYAKVTKPSAGESAKQVEQNNNNNVAVCKENQTQHEEDKDDLTFSVEIEDTEASKRYNLGNAEYRLCVNASDISLQNQHIVHFTWPYKVIRRCGSGQGLFLVEVGRGAASGEGVFRFKTTTPKKLQTAVTTGMRRDSCRRAAPPANVEDLYAKVNKPKHRQKEQ